MSKKIDLNFGGSILKGVVVSPARTVGDNIQSWSTDNNKDLIFYTLEGEDIEDCKEYLVLNLDMPSFFGGGSNGFNGLFLFDAEMNKSIMGLRDLKMGVGQHGCAKLLRTKSSYSPNLLGNYFHPFIMNNHTVAFYVCEGRYHKKWMEGVDEGWTQVSVNQPITYDPFLSLFTTRDAELISDKEADEFSETITN